MPLSSARAAATYQHVQVTSRSPLELVVMLYDGALASLTDARRALVARDFRAKRAALAKALAIVNELQATLNLDAGGDIALSLDNLYTYATGRLVESNLGTDPEPVDEVIRLLTTLRGAWADIASASALPPAAPPAGRR